MSMPPPAANTPDPYAPWRISNFRRYAFSWFLMMFSKHVEFAAVSFHFVNLYDKKTAAFAIGVMALVQAIPVMLLAIPGGQLADRFDRRVILISTIGVTVLGSVALLAVIVLEAPVLWIYGCLIVGAIGRALGSPSRASLLPQLIPAKIFPQAVTWNSTAFYIATVTGPLVGGVLVAIADVRESLAGCLGPSLGGILEVAFKNAAPAFALLVVCRLTAMGAVFLIRHRAPPRGDQPMSWESVAAGAKFVWRTKLILATITLDLFAVLLGGAIYLLPIYANDILKVGAWGFGFLRAADAVGAMCMAFCLAHRPLRKRAGAALVLAIAAFGVWTIVFGVSESFWLSMAALFFIGAMDNISVVVRHTLVQMLTPDEMRGRVSAINGIFIVASNDLGGLESGLVAGLFGPVISVVSGGIGSILVVIGAISLWPQLLKIGSLDSIQPAALPEPDRET
ncbi:MAG: MFS transporter [Pirellulales bacterium]|nr:MFS transporter [Pirellulales bacterium]